MKFTHIIYVKEKINIICFSTHIACHMSRCWGFVLQKIAKLTVLLECNTPLTREWFVSQLTVAKLNTETFPNSRANWVGQ